jgi:hypothetical protein
VHEQPDGKAPKPKPSSHTWASLMLLVFSLDVLACPRCHARMQKISVITQPAVIRAILASVGRYTGAPQRALAPCPYPAKKGDDAATGLGELKELYPAPN